MVHVGAWLCIATLGLGCGRIGFGESEVLVASDASAIDALMPDAAFGAAEELIFGEMATADITGVTIDTSINEPGVDENCGICTLLYGGNTEAGLFRFDLTSVPIGSLINEANVELWLSSLHTLGGKVDFYIIREAWDEGDGDETTGVANWIERKPGIAWTSPGVGPGSRDAVPIATTAPASLEVPVVVTIPLETAQRWVDKPDENHGILLRGSDYTGTGGDHPHFASSKHDSEARRPALRLEFRRPL